METFVRSSWTGEDALGCHEETLWAGIHALEAGPTCWN